MGPRTNYLKYNILSEKKANIDNCQFSLISSILSRINTQMEDF